MSVLDKVLLVALAVYVLAVAYYFYRRATG